MPTLSRVLTVNEIFEEWDRIETALQAIEVPAHDIYLMDVAVESLAYRLLYRARAIGIEVGITEVRQIDNDEAHDLTDTEVLFSFPDEDNAVWFRTMIL